MRQIIVGTVATLASLTFSKRPSLQEGVPSRSDLLRLSTEPKRIEHVSGLSTSSVITSKSLRVEKSQFLSVENANLHQVSLGDHEIELAPRE